MRRPLLVANWKMYKTGSEARAYVRELLGLIPDPLVGEVVLAPPFPALEGVAALLEGSPVGLAAQNLWGTDEGAFTGEVSPAMLRAAGCRYVIVGHSERRHHFGETDALIRQKVAAALRHDLAPILCVGERLEEREARQTFDVVLRQLREGLTDVASVDSVVVAYEPVWAIGTGRTATPEQAAEVHAALREAVRARHGSQAESLRILYGGSVTPENLASLLAEKEVDGALIGGASLRADRFASMVRIMSEAAKGSS